MKSKMINRYPASFYDNLFSGPVVSTPSEMLKMAKILAPIWPRYQSWKKAKIKETRKKYALLATAVAFFVLLLRIWPGFQWWVFVHLRLAITVLPRWSGVRLSNNDCIIPNIPNLIGAFASGGGGNEEEKMPADVECWSCESLRDVRRLNLSEAKMVSQFAAWTQPMLLFPKTDVLPRSFIANTISEVMKEVAKPYTSRADAEPCHFLTNFPHAFEEFLIRFGDYRDQAWFAQWQNCDHDTTKALRLLYRRPQFLPRSFSTMGASWIFLASNYDAHVFREIEISEPWFWLTQISGDSRLQLQPKSKCQSICRNIEIEMSAGVVALIPTSVWSIGYMPKYKDQVENIAYGVESYQEARL